MNEQADKLANDILKTPVLRGEDAVVTFNALSGFLVGYVAGNKSIGEHQQVTILRQVLSYCKKNG